jgi:hypothetical protein
MNLPAILLIAENNGDESCDEEKAKLKINKLSNQNVSSCVKENKNKNKILLAQNSYKHARISYICFFFQGRLFSVISYLNFIFFKFMSTF